MLPMRQTHEKVLVSETEHRNMKGYLQMLCVSYRVCVSLCWRLFQRLSLIGLFLWLAEVLGALESVVMISIDVKGKHDCPSFG